MIPVSCGEFYVEKSSQQVEQTQVLNQKISTNINQEMEDLIKLYNQSKHQTVVDFDDVELPTNFST